MGNGQTIKALREILNVTQKELACESLSRSTISKIEKGTRNLTKEVAEILAPKLRQFQIKKQIKLDYEITVNLLLGINFEEYNKILDALRDNINDYNEAMNYLIQIDNIIYSSSNDVASIILNSLLDILQTRPDKYNRFIKKYADKLIKISKNPTEIVKTHIIIMFALFRTNNYEAICMIGDTVRNEIKFCDKRVAQAFYYNIALAHYESEGYEECLEFIDKGLAINIKAFEMQLKNLEGNVLIKQNKFGRAEKTYLDILSNTSEKNFIANSYNNLGDIYIQQKDFIKANYNLQKALKYINEVSDIYKFNVYFNVLTLRIKTDEDIESFFERTLECAVKLTEVKKKSDVVNLGTSYYSESNDSYKVLNFITILNKFNIEPPYKIIKHLINVTDDVSIIKNI